MFRYVYKFSFKPHLSPFYNGLAIETKKWLAIFNQCTYPFLSAYSSSNMVKMLAKEW